MDSGEAWRVALETAVANGASQVLLGDRPSRVTQRRLAQGVWAAIAPRVIAGLVILNVSVFGGATGVLDPTAANAGTLGAFLLTLVLLTPLLAPFFEIWRFSRMSADEIEAAVVVSEPIQENLDTPMKLFGEDALLDWPGASESVIAERDAYLARAIAAAALGASSICERRLMAAVVEMVYQTSGYLAHETRDWCVVCGTISVGSGFDPA